MNFSETVVNCSSKKINTVKQVSTLKINWKFTLFQLSSLKTEMHGSELFLSLFDTNEQLQLRTVKALNHQTDKFRQSHETIKTFLQ